MTLHVPFAPVSAVTSRDTLPWSDVGAVLAHHARTRPDGLAVAWMPRMGEVAAALTYAELDARARALAARLVAVGAAGGRVLLMLENDLHYAAAFYACVYAGAIAVTLHIPSQARHLARLAHVAADAEAAYVVTTRAMHERFGARVAALPGLDGLTWVIADEVPAEAARGFTPTTPGPDTPAFLQYTSGSTGDPRGVVVRHADLVYQGEYIARLLSLTPEDRALSWLPLFHDMGMILGLLQPVYSGFPVYLSSPVAFVKRPGAWLQAIATLGVTLSGGPDFAYDLCCETVDPADLAGLDLSRWTIAFNGAEPVRARTLDRFAERFGALGFGPASFNPCYGLAEATLGVTATVRGTVARRFRPDPAAFALGRAEPAADPAGAREIVASGRALPDTRLAIVDPASGRALPADRVGEVWVGGTGPAGGYWRQPGPSQATFAATLPDDPGPWLRTGDLGFVDADGLLYVTGRLKDLIVVHGRNHYPSDLEHTAEAVSDQLRPHFAAAFAVERGGHEAVAVLVEVRDARSLDEARATALAREVMAVVGAEHELPIDVVALLRPGQVPKTTSGKVQRDRCRQAWLAGELEAVAVVRRGAAR